MMQRQLPSHPGSADARPTGPGSAASGRRTPRLACFMVVDLAEPDTVLEGFGESRDETSRTAYLAGLQNAVTTHRGRELLRQGDRALVAFATPSAALACAVSIQRAAQRHDRTRDGRLDPRIGIQLGEAVDPTSATDHGEYVAQPAIQARQLCEAALGGHILVSDLVSALARPDASLSFERAGLLDLAGATDPVATFEVHYEQAAGARPPLPPGLAARPRGRCSFVGRASERERLHALWSMAASGQRRLVFAVGEPGIGKSRLAAEFAMAAHGDGAVVLAGRSFEEAIVPYQPFVEALRQYVADCDPSELQAQLGGEPAPLATLVPELAERLPVRSDPAAADGERHRLFDAVARLLSAASLSSPVLLVLDDLQWADPATLLLLKHVVLDPRPASLLILGLYRDTDVGPSHPLAQLQADVERDFTIDRVQLGGLEDRDVASMFDEMVGWSPPQSVARELRDDTEGNPFFLTEFIAQLDESGVAADRERMSRGLLGSGDLDIPTRVREFVARRLGRLSSEAREVLDVAAVVGTEFGLEILAAVLDVELDDLVDRLDEALEANLVVEAAGRPGTYAFAHALFQAALHEGQSINRRALLHARVAAAIETLQPDDPDTLSELARHYALTAGRYAEKVVHYGSAAGDRAYTQLAFEDAVLEYGRALDALPLVASAGERTKADLLVRLGEAQTRVGDATAAKRSFLAATESCVEESSHDILARAALGYGGTGKFGAIFDPFGVVNQTLVDLLERALETCPAHEELTRVRLLGWLAQALYWSDDKERVLALSREALDSARRIGDPTVIALALHSWHVTLWGPDHVPELRAAAEEMLILGRSLGDQDIELKAYTWLVTDALETDSLEVVDDYIAGFTRLAEELHRPYLLGYAKALGATRAHLEGRFDEMIRLMGEQLARAEGADASRAQEAHSWQMALFLLDLGRIDDALLDDLAEQSARYPGLSFGVMSVLAHAIVGRRAEALAELERLLPDDLASIPRDCMWSGTLAMLSRAVCKLGAVGYARPLYDLLAPFADRNSLWGSGFIVFGPVSRFLGMLATAFDEPGRAIAHLEDALERSAGLRSPPLAARAGTELARALLARGAEGDEVRALALLEEARVAAAGLGMPALHEETTDLLRVAPGSSTRTIVESP